MSGCRTGAPATRSIVTVLSRYVGAQPNRRNVVFTQDAGVPSVHCGLRKPTESRPRSLMYFSYYCGGGDV